MGPIQSSINTSLAVAGALASQSPTFRAGKTTEEANKAIETAGESYKSENKEYRISALKQGSRKTEEAIKANLEAGKNEKAEDLQYVKNKMDNLRSYYEGTPEQREFNKKMDKIIKDHAMDPEIEREIANYKTAISHSQNSVDNVNSYRERMKTVKKILSEKKEDK